MSSGGKEPKQQYTQRARITRSTAHSDSTRAKITRSTAYSNFTSESDSAAATTSTSVSTSARRLLVSPEGATVRRSPPRDLDDGSSIDTVLTPPPSPTRNLAAAALDPLIYEDFDDLPATMTATDDDYLAGLDAHHKKPITNPNLSDVTAVVFAIGNALQYESTYYGSATGLGFLVDDEKTQLLRDSHEPSSPPTGWTTAVEPTQPSIPTLLDPAAKLKFELDTKNYQIFRACMVQVLRLLDKLFPVLKGNKNSLGIYPTAFTARKAITYITTHYSCPGRKRAAAAGYRTECHSLQYNHSAAGLTAFLQKLGQLQYRLSQLGEMKIPDSELITLTQIAFRNSVPITAINIIFTEWDTAVKTNGYTADNSWSPFQEFFATALVKAWADYGPNTDHHGSAALLRERISELEANHDILDANLHEIHTSYSAVGGGQSVPGTVLTDESSMLQTQINKMEAMLISLQDNRSTGINSHSGGGCGGDRGGRGSGRGGRGRGSARNPGTFRPYNKYYPIRGVNLRCKGGTECRCHPKTTNVEATYEDPSGDSRRNWTKYGGLCGPDNQYYKTKPSIMPPSDEVEETHLKIMLQLKNQ